MHASMLLNFAYSLTTLPLWHGDTRVIYFDAIIVQAVVVVFALVIVIVVFPRGRQRLRNILLRQLPLPRVPLPRTEHHK